MTDPVRAIDEAVPNAPADRLLRDTSRALPWVGVVLGLCAVLLVPWVFYLGFSLPERQTSAHYDVAWAGFDVFLFLGLAGTAITVLRRSPWMGIWAGAVAALLITDAWFDVVTSPTGHDFWQALVLAVLVELPLAGTCVWVVGHARRMARRRIRHLLRSAARRAD
ncbi:hypothetical protein D9V37_13175 [Nocardioides mangrovicus]|uniref:DUF4345 domain-containing protein n=1 Tax=Nocardioides mangrovicus TaxID=2478913 RepID=A0A3L8P196_9ACTN|nr:hypothetical protein [Nocardioides mangrovicus]RLV48682.1 hypothetical protein D9V37_13175 [Nocardioides mangrovicus]